MEALRLQTRWVRKEEENVIGVQCDAVLMGTAPVPTSYLGISA